MSQTPSPVRHAVVLLSGGLDSTTVLAMALAAGRTVTALSFRYGQRHTHELTAAKATARRYGVEDWICCDIDLGKLGGSALTDADLSVPMDGESTGIPITYVPARNTIFLSYALAVAEVRGADEIHLGVNAVDYSGYPDCRPEYLAAFETMAGLATRRGVEGDPVRIVAPLLHLSKGQIITAGLALGVDYGRTHSCYAPAVDSAACGRCDACRLRLAGFAAADATDPARYQS
jgi:7-cyano-7-deazaguanine synthase